jgi:hypothetical protein
MEGQSYHQGVFRAQPNDGLQRKIQKRNRPPVSCLLCRTRKVGGRIFIFTFNSAKVYLAHPRPRSNAIGSSHVRGASRAAKQLSASMPPAPLARPGPKRGLSSPTFGPSMSPSPARSCRPGCRNSRRWSTALCTSHRAQMPPLKPRRAQISGPIPNPVPNWAPLQV